MGLIGGQLGKIGGGALGGALGKKYGGSTGEKIGSELGSVAGGALGTLLPFKKGGKVPGPKGKAVKALVHGGEYVLPAGVKPTKAQKAAVAKLHKKGKKM